MIRDEASLRGNRSGPPSPVTLRSLSSASAAAGVRTASTLRNARDPINYPRHSDRRSTTLPVSVAGCFEMGLRLPLLTKLSGGGWPVESWTGTNSLKRRFESDEDSSRRHTGPVERCIGTSVANELRKTVQVFSGSDTGHRRKKAASKADSVVLRVA